MRNFVALAVVFGACASLFSQANNSAALANRRTALRCLENAVSSISEKKYDSALNQISLGMAYDDSISDLWYFLAVADHFMGHSKAEVIELLEKSFECNGWVKYNQDNARLMYADLLSDTGRFLKAIEVLDQTPGIFSSDAEFIRAKSYYRAGDSVSVSRARNKIDAARRIYPNDTRFPLLFFKNEYPGTRDTTVVRLTDFFISQISQYAEAAPDKDAELEIYASTFVSGIEQEHLLKSFAARGLRHPLYAKTAMEAGLITEEAAFDYITTFADDSIDFDILQDFISALSNERVISLARDYFIAYSGVIEKDTDTDGIANLFVRYARGRPETVYYDENQDGRLTWTCICDFGLPLSVKVFDKNYECFWNSFPNLSKLVIGKNELVPYDREYEFVLESMKWSPLSVEKDALFSEKLGVDFFVPFPDELEPIFDLKKQVLESCANFTIYTDPAKDEKICFNFIKGAMSTANYFSNGKQYAQATFENNVPAYRSVDSDGDGVFETTEIYELDSESENGVYSQSIDLIALITKNLYGFSFEDAGFHLKMVQVDTDGDAVQNYTEEYLARGGKICSWDNDRDGNWDVRHVTYPKDESGDIYEESFFFATAGKIPVSVKTKNGEPLSVTYGSEAMEVVRDKNMDLYWIGPEGLDFGSNSFRDLAKRCVETLALCDGKTVSQIIEADQWKVICIRVDSMNFGIIAGNKNE